MLQHSVRRTIIQPPPNSFAYNPLLLPVILRIDIVKKQVLQDLHRAVTEPIIIQVHAKLIRIAEANHDALCEELVQASLRDNPRMVGVVSGRLCAETRLAAIAVASGRLLCSFLILFVLLVLFDLLLFVIVVVQRFPRRMAYAFVHVRLLGVILGADVLIFCVDITRARDLGPALAVVEVAYRFY